MRKFPPFVLAVIVGFCGVFGQVITPPSSGSGSNGSAITQSGTNAAVAGDLTAHSGNFTNALQLNGVGVTTKSGSSAAGDVAVFDGTDQTLRRSTSAANFGDSSSSTFTVNFGLSGATDPVLTAANNSLSANTSFSANDVQAAATGLVGFTGRSHWKSPANGSLTAYFNNGSTLAALTAGTLTLTPASADTTAVTVSGGSTTGSGTTKAATFSHTANTSGNIDGVYTFTLVDTASGASTFHSKWLGGAAGTTVLASLNKSGALVLASSITVATGSLISDATRGSFRFVADGEAQVRNAAGTGLTSFALGPDDSSPNSASLKGASGVGTDIAGGTINIAAGASTGTGRGGAVILQTSPSGSTGSSANAYSERAHWIPKAVTLTESTATTVATIAVPSAKFVGGSCTVTVFASDATDHQARTLTFPFSAINKAGTVTAGLGTPVEGVAVSSGTLTATITTVANGNAVDIKVDATSSLTQTTLNATVSIPAINSNDTAAVTEI